MSKFFLLNYELCHEKSCFREFATREDSNWSAQPQRLPTSLEILDLASISGDMVMVLVNDYHSDESPVNNFDSGEQAMKALIKLCGSSGLLRSLCCSHMA